MTRDLSLGGELATTGRAHVIVTNILKPALSDDDRHHLQRVLRIKPEEVITATDGQGSWRACRLVSGELVMAGDIVSEEEPKPSLAVGFPLLKVDRPEWIVQKLTEVGIDRIVVLDTERSVVRPPAERLTRQLERFRRIAREASMQSRRAWVPTVEGPLSPAHCATESGAALADFGGELPSPKVTFVMVAPEGGWTNAERSLSLPKITLGATVLRSETAALMAGALLVALRTGLVNWSHQEN